MRDKKRIRNDYRWLRRLLSTQCRPCRPVTVKRDGRTVAIDRKATIAAWPYTRKFKSGRNGA